MKTALLLALLVSSLSASASYCKRDGQACDDNSICCSSYCNFSTMTCEDRESSPAGVEEAPAVEPMSCQPSGSYCDVDSECCSYSCGRFSDAFGMCQ